MDWSPCKRFFDILKFSWMYQNRILAMTFIRPTALPNAHLLDMEACAKFDSDHIFYTVSVTGQSGKWFHNLVHQKLNQYSDLATNKWILQCKKWASRHLKPLSGAGEGNQPWSFTLNHNHIQYEWFFEWSITFYDR